MQANLFSNLIIRSTGEYYCSRRQIKREINGKDSEEFIQVHDSYCFCRMCMHTNT